MSPQEPFYSPNAKLAPARQPKPGEHVWSLRKAERRVDCELRFHGESYGWECQCLYNGDLALPNGNCALRDAPAYSSMIRRIVLRTRVCSCNSASVGSRRGSSGGRCRLLSYAIVQRPTSARVASQASTVLVRHPTQLAESRIGSGRHQRA